MKTIARLLGGGADSDRKMMDIYDFENNIVQVRLWNSNIWYWQVKIKAFKQSWENNCGLRYEINKAFYIMPYTVTLNFSFLFSLLSSHFVFQSVNPERISGDIIESLREDHRSGRSLDSLDKTLDDFCTDSTFNVRKKAIPCSLFWSKPWLNRSHNSDLSPRVTDC